MPYVSLELRMTSHPHSSLLYRFRFLLPVALCALFASRQAFASGPQIMAMGDSITVGVDYETVTAGGYRDPLYRDLTAAGLSFNFIGINNGLATPLLTSANQQLHSGFGGWQVGDLNANLDGVAAPVGGGDSNNGGYLLTGGHGTGRGALTPDLLLLEIGTNDLLQGTANLNQSLYTLVTHIHALSPNTLILVAAVTPINNSGMTARVNAYNSYIQTQLVPSLSYTRFVDQNSGLLNHDGSANSDLLGTDNVHPNRYGYPILAQQWAKAIEAVEQVKVSANSLTVQGGSGSGSYPPGTVVTLQATAPAANQQFSNWTPSTTALGNPYATPVVYTMPAGNATVTANYAVQGSPIIPNGNYSIVSNFNGLAVAAAGTTSSSAVQQQTYSNGSTQNWTVTNLGGNVVTLILAGTNQALEVPAASASTDGGTLDIAPYTGAANQQWSLTPVFGVLDLVNQSTGKVVNVAGYSTSSGSPLLQFDAGYVDDWWVFYPSSAQVSQYALTVNQGSGGGTYAAGTVVPVMANPAPNASQFTGWTGAISGLANTSAASTTLIMPASANTITAAYSTAAPTQYTLSVSGGTGSGSYAAGTVISVTANTAPAGSQFSGWTGTTGALTNASAASTTFTMPAAAATLSATYTTLQVPASAASSNSIVSVQFVGGGASPLRGQGYNYTAGAPGFAVSNWNPVMNTGNTSTPQNLSVNGTLLTSTGAVSSIGFQVRSSGAYYTGAGTGFAGSAYPGYAGQSSGVADKFLYSGFAYAGYSDASPLSLTLQGLNPAHTYTVLAYVTPFEGFGGNQSAAVTLTGASTTYVVTDGGAAVYEHASGASAGSAGTGNYVEFDQLTGSATQTLTLTNTGSLVGLSGFQVVDLGTGSSGSAPVAPAPIAPAPVSPTPVAPAPVSGAVSSIVSIQFVGGGAAPLHSASFDYTAGAQAAGHWNSLLMTGNTTSMQSLNVASGLTDSNGAASGLGVQLSASGAYYTGAGTKFTGAPAYPGYPGQSSGNGDSFLYSGFAYAGYSNKAPLTLTVNGLNPAHTYEVLVYVAPFEQFGDNQTATVALTGGSVLQVNPTGTASAYQRGGATQGSSAGNYVEFDALKGSSSQTITFTNTSVLVGVSGVQVVDLGQQ